MSYEFATIDIETTGLNRYKHSITWIGVGLATDVESPLSKTLIYNAEDPVSLEKFIALMRKIKTHKVKTVFQNGKFDTLFIEQHLGLKIPINEDVMLMGTAFDLVAGTLRKRIN